MRLKSYWIGVNLEERFIRQFRKILGEILFKEEWKQK